MFNHIWKIISRNQHWRFQLTRQWTKMLLQSPFPPTAATQCLTISNKIDSQNAELLTITTFTKIPKIKETQWPKWINRSRKAFLRHWISKSCILPIFLNQVHSQVILIIWNVFLCVKDPFNTSSLHLDQIWIITN